MCDIQVSMSFQTTISNKSSQTFNSSRSCIMNMLKKLVALVVLVGTLSSSLPLCAQEYAVTGGEGYEESRRSPSIAPSIALGAIALAAIIAIAVQNRSHHKHSHSH